MSTVTGKINGHEFRLGRFYMRIRDDLELYISDMGDDAGMVFSQREVDSTGAYSNYYLEDELVSTLRQAMVLDDLANV